MPKNTFVARVLGNPSMNFIECTVKEEKERICIIHEGFDVYAGKKRLGGVLESCKKGVILGIRPEDIVIYFDRPDQSAVTAEVYVTEPLGNKTIVDIKTGKNVIKAIAPASFGGKPGRKVWIGIKESKLHLFDKTTKGCVYHAEQEGPLTLV